jgi:hypothetical protein
VAVGMYGAMAASVDGRSWHSIDSQRKDVFTAIVWTGSRLVAGGILDSVYIAEEDPIAVIGHGRAQRPAAAGIGTGTFPFSGHRYSAQGRRSGPPAR